MCKYTKFLRYIVPPRDEQTEITPSFAFLFMAPIIPLVYMGYLARLSNTHLQRTLIFPIPFLLWVRIASAYRSTDPLMLGASVLKTFVAIIMAARTVEFLLVDEKGIKKRGDVDRQKPVTLLDGVELLASFRNIEYEPHNSKLNIYIPKETKPLERRAFIFATLRHCVLGLLLMDFMESCWKFYPPFQQGSGGSIFIPGAPWFVQLCVTGFLLLATTIVFTCILLVGYDIFTLLGVIILRQSPTLWPPLLDRPFHKQSVGSFWSVGWHSLTRRTFLHIGGYPSRWLVQRLFKGLDGDFGLLFGSFFASAFFHEFPVYWAGLPFDWRTPVFFSLQPIGISLERLWKLKTGRRVSGLPGMLWTYMFWTIGLGPHFMDSYHYRGLAHTTIVPYSISPTRRLLFPLLTKILPSFELFIQSFLEKYTRS